MCPRAEETASLEANNTETSDSRTPSLENWEVQFSSLSHLE